MSRVYVCVMSRVYVWVMSRVYVWVMSHMYVWVMSRVYVWVMSHMYVWVMSHVYVWVMSHMYVWVMSHIKGRHVTRIRKGVVSLVSQAALLVWARHVISNLKVPLRITPWLTKSLYVSHVLYIKETCYTYVILGDICVIYKRDDIYKREMLHVCVWHLSCMCYI